MIFMVAQLVLLAAALPAVTYIVLLGLVTVPLLQAHVVYLHALRLTWFKDLDKPHAFGFLRNQVTPFYIPSTDCVKLYVWHVLPLGLYQRHAERIAADASGLARDMASRAAFRLLRDDPEARLVIHMHGVAGTVGSGYRPLSYRTLGGAQPDKVHVLAWDYRGFGRSSGSPEERGIIADAVSVVEWALTVPQVAPSRIILFGQSLGAAVSVAVAHHYATREPPMSFAGVVLLAPFADIPSLVSTYRIAGMVPILGPLANFPSLLGRLRPFIRDTWVTNARIAACVRLLESRGSRYDLAIIHSVDDSIVPWRHASLLFQHAVDATRPEPPQRGAPSTNATRPTLGGQGGSSTRWVTKHGVLRREIVPHGEHRRIAADSVATMAVLRLVSDRQIRLPRNEDEIVTGNRPVG